MHEQHDKKYVPVTPPAAAVDDAAVTTIAVDTKGWHELTFLIILGAADIGATVQKVQESDASNMSGATDVPGNDAVVGGIDLDGNTVAANAAKVAATDTDKIIAHHINLHGGRKRYMDLSLTNGNGTAGNIQAILAILSCPDQSPTSDAQRGLRASLLTK